MVGLGASVIKRTGLKIFSILVGVAIALVCFDGRGHRMAHDAGWKVHTFCKVIHPEYQHVRAERRP
jgi:hypothetical protein